MPKILVPAKYRSIHFSAMTCCKLRLAVYPASLFMVKAILGLVLFARYWSSPRSLANELLQFPSFPSRFDLNLMLRSNGVPTLLISLSPSCSKMDLMYNFCEMVMEFSVWVISIPMNLVGSLRSVIPIQYVNQTLFAA